MVLANSMNRPFAKLKRPKAVPFNSGGVTSAISSRWSLSRPHHGQRRRARMQSNLLHILRPLRDTEQIRGPHRNRNGWQRVPHAKGFPLPTILGVLPGMSAFATAMMKREMEKLDIPPIPEFIEMIHDAGGKIYACKATVDLFHLKAADFCPQVDKVLTVGEFYALR